MTVFTKESVKQRGDYNMNNMNCGCEKACVAWISVVVHSLAFDACFEMMR